MTQSIQTPCLADGDAPAFALPQKGNQEAWRDLFDRCYNKLVRVIRRKLTRFPNIRRLYDSTDFASDVWKSLAAKDSGQFNFPSINAFMAFLIHAAEQKLIDQVRAQYARKRDIERERPLEGMRGPNNEAPELASSDPTPSQFALGNETYENLKRGRSEAEQEAIGLKFHGYTNGEIAEELGLHIRKIQRMFQEMQDTLEPSRKGRRP